MHHCSFAYVKTTGGTTVKAPVCDILHLNDAYALSKDWKDLLAYCHVNCAYIYFKATVDRCLQK